MKVTVAATQMACGWDREANIANAERLVRAAAKQGANVILIQELFEAPHAMTMSDHKILVVHDIGDVVERSVLAHAVVVHGHTHLQEMKTRNNTLIVNPGEACGWLYGAPSAAILDLATKQVEFIKLDGTEWKS